MKKLAWVAIFAAAGCGGTPEGGPVPADQARSISSPLRLQDCPDPNNCTVPDAATEKGADGCVDTHLSPFQNKPPTIRDARVAECTPR